MGVMMNFSVSLGMVVMASISLLGCDPSGNGDTTNKRKLGMNNLRTQKSFDERKLSPTTGQDACPPAPPPAPTPTPRYTTTKEAIEKNIEGLKTAGEHNILGF